MNKTMNTDKRPPVYESCALCSQPTGVLVNMPIENRTAYVDTAGQLCKRCYFETCIKQPKKNGSEDTQDII